MQLMQTNIIIMKHSLKPTEPNQALYFTVQWSNSNEIFANMKIDGFGRNEKCVQASLENNFF